MGIIKEFKEFAIKGNMFDMAVGIIIGTAFNNIVSSLVKDIITPMFGFWIGDAPFQELKIILNPKLPTKQVQFYKKPFLSIMESFWKAPSTSSLFPLLFFW